MRHVILIAALAFVVAPVLAGPDVQPVTGMRHAVLNLATGEISPATGAERYGDSVWAATQRSGYYYVQHYYGPGTTTLDWGDIEGPQIIGGFAMSYATDVVLPELMDCVLMFFADENGFDSVDRVYLAGFDVTDLPTGDPAGAWNGWTVTLDLEASGLNFTIDGQDLDTFPGMDFGYTYWFHNYTPTTNNYTGPTIAGDPNVIPQTAPGIEDAFDKFADPNLETLLGTYTFTGIFAQFYMELFEGFPPNIVGCPEPGGSGNYCWADIDCGEPPCDCIVSLADLAQLLGNYGTASGAAHGDGDVDPVDGDGDVDLADLAALLAQYGDDCN